MVEMLAISVIFNIATAVVAWRLKGNRTIRESLSVIVRGDMPPDPQGGGGPGEEQG